MVPLPGQWDAELKMNSPCRSGLPRCQARRFWTFPNRSSTEEVESTDSAASLTGLDQLQMQTLKSWTNHWLCLSLSFSVWKREIFIPPGIIVKKGLNGMTMLVLSTLPDK